MTNIDFKNKYGKREFNDMCKYVIEELSIAKAQKQLGGFKINNTKKYVRFFINNKSICIEFATIFQIGCEKIEKYLTLKGSEKSEES